MESGIGRYYTPEQEVKLDYSGREVLYVVGEAVVESSCCGVGRWKYVIVPGYVVSWQNAENEAGLAVSEVEPISDKEARDNIKRTIERTEATSLVGFW